MSLCPAVMQVPATMQVERNDKREKGLVNVVNEARAARLYIGIKK